MAQELGAGAFRLWADAFGCDTPVDDGNRRQAPIDGGADELDRLAPDVDVSVGVGVGVGVGMGVEVGVGDGDGDGDGHVVDAAGGRDVAVMGAGAVVVVAALGVVVVVAGLGVVVVVAGGVEGTGVLVGAVDGVACAVDDTAIVFFADLAGLAGLVNGVVVGLRPLLDVVRGALGDAVAVAERRVGVVDGDFDGDGYVIGMTEADASGVPPA